MSRVYLVRHGQAAFGTDDYDRLTETGIAQCQQLARHWRAIGRHVDLVYSGTLRRQRESAEAFAKAAAEQDGVTLPVQSLAGIEEYDHLSLLAAHLGDSVTSGEFADRSVAHRRLSAALKAWAAGELSGV